MNLGGSEDEAGVGERWGRGVNKIKIDCMEFSKNLNLKCSEMGIGAVKRARGTRNIQMATSWCKKSLSLSTPVQPTVKHSSSLSNYGGWEEPCVLAHRRLCGKRGWAEEPHLPGGSLGGNEALPWAGPLGASSATHPEICFLL